MPIYNPSVPYISRKSGNSFDLVGWFIPSTNAHKLTTVANVLLHEFLSYVVGCVLLKEVPLQTCLVLLGGFLPFATRVLRQLWESYAALPWAMSYFTSTTCCQYYHCSMNYFTVTTCCQYYHCSMSSLTALMCFPLPLRHRDVILIPGEEPPRASCRCRCPDRHGSGADGRGELTLASFGTPEKANTFN